MIPTKLYIKRHSKTGLMYFGKTTRSNINSYKGSGKYWTSHLAEHGKNLIDTVWVKEFKNEVELVDFALAFSEIFDIVESKKWANLKEENGLDGGSTPGHVSEEGRKRTLDAVKGIPKTEDHKQKIKEARSRQIITEEAKRKMSATRTGKRHSEETRAKMKATQQALAAERLKNKLLNQ